MTTNRTKHSDLIAAAARREERALQRILELSARRTQRQQAGSFPRAVRAVFSTLLLADSHGQSLNKLDRKLAAAEAQLADIRMARRTLEATAVARDLLSDDPPMRARANDEVPNTWSARALPLRADVMQGEMRMLSRNEWARGNKQTGVGA